MGLVIRNILRSDWCRNPTLPKNPMATDSYTTFRNVTGDRCCLAKRCGWH